MVVMMIMVCMRWVWNGTFYFSVYSVLLFSLLLCCCCCSVDVVVVVVVIVVVEDELLFICSLELAPLTEVYDMPVGPTVYILYLCLTLPLKH